MSEWRDIESAPKTGEDILLFDASVHPAAVPMAVGYWNGVNFCHLRKALRPTHWMPLPPPPR